MAITAAGVLALGILQDGLSAIAAITVFKKLKGEEDWEDTFCGGVRHLDREGAVQEFRAKQSASTVSKLATGFRLVKEHPEFLTLIPQEKDEEGNPVTNPMLENIYAFARTRQF